MDVHDVPPFDDLAKVQSFHTDTVPTVTQTKVMVDKKVALQLLKELLLDPLAYAEFDHFPPMMQAQLDFIVARNDTVGDPHVAADNPPPDAFVSDIDNNTEPIPENVNAENKAFADKGHGHYPAVEQLSISLL